MPSSKIHRESLLHKLESVEAGLSKREMVEQSSCFVFNEEGVHTFNDEISCSYLGTENLPSIHGAVRAEPLLALLRKLPSEEIEILQEEDALILIDQRRKGSVAMEKEILLPFDRVERPKKWSALPVEFGEAVSCVSECAGKDPEQFLLSCVHVHPKYVEAFDNIQASRFKLSTGVSEPFLVRASSLKSVADMGMNKTALTPSWVHFKNKSGLRISCRRDLSEYVSLSKLFKVEGTHVTMPKGLSTAAEIASVFTQENPDTNFISIEMKKGRLTLCGRGASGSYRETTKLPDYKGDPIEFLISPNLLIQFSNKHHSCELSSEFLKVESGPFVYVTCLSSKEDVERVDEGETEEE